MKNIALCFVSLLLSAQTVSFPGPGMSAASGGGSISSAPVHEGTGSWSSGSSFAVTITAPTSGNTLIAASCSSAATPTISSITSTNVTWRGTAAISSATNEACSIWCGDVGASAGTTVTFNLSAASGAHRANVSEWSGIAACASAQDASGSGSNNGTSATPTTATVTPTASRNALLIACTRKAGTFTAGSETNGFTTLTTANSGWRYSYLVVSSTSGTYSTGWTFSTSTVYDAEIAAFLH